VTGPSRESSHVIRQAQPSSLVSVPLRYSERPRWHLVLDAWAIAVLVAAAAQVLFSLGAYQWDVVVYWWGGRAFASGHSPYGAIPGQPVYLHYVYPPLTAALFAPLATINVAASKVIWISLKALAFALTARMWLRAINARMTVIPPIFFFTFAFGSALLVDFTSGNIAVFEQLVLWLAFTALLARRPWTFALLVAAVSQLKLTPIFFLGALLVVDDRPLWKPFAGGTVLFAALLGANALVVPAQAHEFLTSVSSLGERGWGDPSTLGVMQDLVDQLNGLKVPVPMAVAYLLYAAAVLAVFVYTVRWWRRRRAEGGVDRLAVILVTIAVYALVMPRMKDYSYVALLPVAWYALSRATLQTVPFVIVAALVPRPLPQLKLWLPMMTQAYVYAPLVGALAVWMAIVGEGPARSAQRELGGSPERIAA
jgi:alpha-1,2-mannosyltransferase